jgi:hypothetical protein
MRTKGADGCLERHHGTVDGRPGQTHQFLGNLVVPDGTVEALAFYCLGFDAEGEDESFQLLSHLVQLLNMVLLLLIFLSKLHFDTFQSRRRSRQSQVPPQQEVPGVSVSHILHFPRLAHPGHIPDQYYFHGRYYTLHGKKRKWPVQAQLSMPEVT